MFSRYLVVSSLIALILTSGCSEEEPPSRPAFDPENPSEYINSWILDELNLWYLWNDELPQSVNLSLDPDVYFESLLVPQDRFSWIQDNYQELLNSLKGVSLDTGHEVRYLFDGESDVNVIAQVLYVKPQSPSEFAGMRRGDMITHVNGVRLTQQNFRDLNNAMDEPHEILFRRYNFDTELLEDMGPVTISPVQIAENPNYLDSIYSFEGQKIGYYIYNQFSADPGNNSDVYVSEMDQVFANFKAAQIDALVLDLRYNPGGNIDVAKNLGSLIGKGITAQDIFALKQYNSSLQQQIINSPSLGQSFLEEKFEFKVSNIGNLIDQVYILTGYRTASASELVINGLKPFMGVTMIGDTTVGKNQGSITLFEEDDPNNDWGMQPIVLNIANSLGDSDYGDGFAPNVFDKDNAGILYPLGDIRENLLSKAIEEITGFKTARYRDLPRLNDRLAPPSDQQALPMITGDKLSADRIRNGVR